MIIIILGMYLFHRLWHRIAVVWFWWDLHTPHYILRYKITVTVACWSSLGCSPSIEFLKKKQKCESIIIVTSNFLGIWWRLLEPQFAARLDFVHWRLTMRDEKFGTLFLYRISMFPIPWWPHLCRRIDQRHDWQTGRQTGEISFEYVMGGSIDKTAMSYS